MEITNKNLIYVWMNSDGHTTSCLENVQMISREMLRRVVVEFFMRSCRPCRATAPSSRDVAALL